MHTQQALLLNRHQRNLLTYIDGTMLGNIVGAGVYVNPKCTSPDGLSTRSGKTYPMGHQMEAYDAELYGIQQAAEHALQHCKRIRRKRVVWIFTDNQAAFMRIRPLKPGPGQEISIVLAHISTELTTLKCTLTTQWVPDTLMWPRMKKLTDSQLATTQRPPATFRTSLSYLKRVARPKV